jgi:hypothetical protein
VHVRAARLVESGMTHRGAGPSLGRAPPPDDRREVADAEIVRRIVGVVG